MSFMPFTGFPSVFWKFWGVFSVKHEKGSIGLRSVPQQCVDFGVFLFNFSVSKSCRGAGHAV